jgi:hypothetical protein
VVERLRALVRASDAGMPVLVVQVAPVTLALMADAKKLADTMLETYKEGVTYRLPTPWLSAMKSSVAALDTFCDLELFAPEVARVKSEIAGLATFAGAFGLPQAAALKDAADALKVL